MMINKGTVIIVNKGMMINKNVNKRMVIVNADYGDVLSNKRINLMMIMSQKMIIDMMLMMAMCFPTQE